MGKISDAMEGLKPAIGMVVVMIAFTGMNIFYKLAANDGMNLKIMVAYRFLFAAVFIIPLALYVERNTRPKMTWTVLFLGFLCGLFGGCGVQILYIESLALTSATFAAAMTNLMPVVTFTLAVSLGLESVGLGTVAGKAKVVGTLIGIGGAMLLTFYIGVEINLWSTHVHLLKEGPHNGGHAAASGGQNQVLGGLLALGSCVCFAVWLNIQAKMAQIYPCPYSITALMVVMGAIQTVAMALCMERDWSQWKLGWNIRLLTVLYLAIAASGVAAIVMAWCVQKRGPLYASVFNPLMLVLVAIAGSLLLDEKLNLGSVLGAVLIVIGLYFVLWGKSKETKTVPQLKQKQKQYWQSQSNDFSTKSEQVVDVTSSRQNSSKASRVAPDSCPI